MYPQKSEEELHSGLIAEDSKECGLTEEEYKFLQDDIAFQIAAANRKYGYGGYGFVDRFGNHYPDPRPRTVPESDLALKALEKEPPHDRRRKYRADRLRTRTKPKIAVAAVVKKSKIQDHKGEAECLEFLRSKMRRADPILKKKFQEKIEGVEF